MPRTAVVAYGIGLEAILFLQQFFLECMVLLINWPSHSCSFYHSLPPVTKAYGTICFLTTVAYQLNLINPEWLYLDFALVIKKYQVR